MGIQSRIEQLPVDGVALMAQVGGRTDVSWRRVGTIARAGAECRVAFDAGARILEPAFAAALVQDRVRDTGLICVRFGAWIPQRGLAILGEAPLTGAVLRDVRRIAREMGATDVSRPRFSLLAHGLRPRLRSSWPDGGQFVDRRRRRSGSERRKTKRAVAQKGEV